MDTPALPKRTYGENLLAKLVSKLPKDEFFAIAQPRLIDRDGKGWKPDYVIISAQMGVIILEIKDWVSIVEADRETVTIQKRDKTLETLPNPVETAQNYAYVLADMCKERQELLVTHNRVRRLAFPWQYAVALPNISRKTIAQLERGNIWEKGVALGQEDLQDSQTLEKALRELPWRFTLKEPINNTLLDVIRGVIYPHIRILNEEGEDEGKTETRTQTLIIQEPLPPLKLPGLEDPQFSVRLVRGVAGSGKTLVMLRRAFHLKEQHPELRVLVMAFNRDLSDNLRKKVENPDIEVMDFHQLCIRITGRVDIQKPLYWLERNAAALIEQAGLTPQFVAEEIAWRKETGLLDDADYLDAPRSGRGSGLLREKRQIINEIFSQYREYQQAQQTKNKAWVDWEDVPLLTLQKLDDPQCEFRQRYDVILIDEAQDFAPVWFNVIKAVLKPGASLFICDDPTQSLFRYYSWRQKGIDVVGHTRTLHVPFRNTREISIAAHSLIQSDTTLKQSDDVPVPNFKSYELPKGERPLLVQCASRDEEIAFVEQQITRLIKAGITDIAILCQTHAQVKQWEKLRVQQIYVSSFARMKGLEFQAVIIPHLNQLFEGQAVDAEVITTQRRKLFTAMTRACETLILSYHGELPVYLEVLKSYTQQ